MTPTLLSVLVALATLAYLGLLGYGVALLVLPVAWRPWFWVAAPLVGLVVAALGLGWLVLVLPGGAAGLVLLGAALVLAVGLTARGLRPPGEQHRLEQMAVATVALLALALAVAPLVGRPDLVSIGPNWDIEIYLPMAAYLQQSPLGFGLSAPGGTPFAGLPNPLLWRVNFFDPRWSGLTFSELQAALDGLLGLAPHQTLVGVLAAVFALFPVAAFVLARAALGAGPRSALAVAVLATLGAPGLYVVFWSFGQQASALPLLPLALAAFLTALQQAGGRARWAAATTAAALLASYVPAVPVYAVGAAVCGVAAAVTGRQWRSALATVAAVVGGAALMAPWAVLRCVERARHFLDDQGVAGLTVGPDVREFPPAAWVFGLFPTPDQGLAGVLERTHGAPEFLLLRFVLFGVVFAGAVWLWQRQRYAAAALALAPAVVFLTLHYVLPYPYGYQKTVPFVTPILLAFLVLGAGAVWGAEARWQLLRRVVVVAGAIALLAVNAASAAHLVGQMGSGSPMAYRAAEGLTAAVPAGAPVFVSGHRDMWGPKGGAVAYALRGADLYGYLPTGFSTFYRQRDDGAYAYALFSQAEPAWREVFGSAEPAWSGLGLRLYRVPDGVQGYLDLSAGAAPVIEKSGGQGGTAGKRYADWMDNGYPVFEGWSPPLLGTLAETTAPQVRYPAVTHGVNFDTDLPAVGGWTGPRRLSLTLATFRAQPVTVRVGNRTMDLDVPVGLSSHDLGPVGAAATVTVLDNGNPAPLWVRSLTLREVAAPAVRYPDAALVLHGARLAEDGVVLDVAYEGPAYQAVVDVYSVDGATHYGYWVARAAPRAEVRALRLRLDTVQHRLVSLQRREGAAPFDSWRGAEPDGDYRIYLFLYKDGKVVNQVALSRFTLRNKRTVSVTTEPGDLFIG